MALEFAEIGSGVAIIGKRGRGVVVRRGSGVRHRRATWHSASGSAKRAGFGLGGGSTGGVASVAVVTRLGWGVDSTLAADDGSKGGPVWVRFGWGLLTQI